MLNLKFGSLSKLLFLEETRKHGVVKNTDLTTEEYNKLTEAIATLIERLEVEYVSGSEERPSHIEDLYHLGYETILDLAENGKSFKKDVTIGHNDIVLEGECHAVSAMYMLLYPSRFELWSGVTDAIHAHSWVMYKGDSSTIIEPTPIIRERYFGVKVKDIDAFIEAELPRIRDIMKANKLPFVIEKKLREYLG